MAGLSFTHRFEPGAKPDALPLLLLHGTGGNEHDLISLGQAIAPGAALLAPRGKVLEHGMPRFFRRLAEGVFDEDDVRRRAHELADFVEAARKEYGIATPIALGYSNGANIAAAMMPLRPEVLGGGILLRAMVPLASGVAPASLFGKGALIVSGLQRSDRVTGTRGTAQEPARSCRCRGRAPERSRWSRANASRHHAGAGVAASSPFCDEVE